jgi:hypothetical protein
VRAIKPSERCEQSNPASGASNQTQRAERAIKPRARSVIARPQRAAYRQQLELGTVGDQLLDRIEYLDQMCSISADRRYADARTTVQLKMINFGHTELESLAHVGDQWAHHRALLLQRMDISKH